MTKFAYNVLKHQLSILVVKDLHQYIESTVIDLEQRGKLHFDGFYDYLWLLFSGDKGEKLVKVLFEAINSKNASSVYNVQIYAMYGGSDCRQNILVLLTFL